MKRAISILWFLTISLTLTQGAHAASGTLKKFYSKRFNMGLKGVPLAKIGIYTGISSVRITAPTGLTVKSGNGAGLTASGASSFVVTKGRTTPAKVRYWISMKSVPSTDRKAYLKAYKEMQRLGIKTTPKEQGFIIALRGKVLDTRRILFSVGPFPTYQGAKKRLVKLAKNRHGVFVHSELVHLPAGTMSAQSGRFTLSVVSVLTFATATGKPVTVTSGGISRAYPGIIHVVVGRDGNLAVVNELDMETYLAGILPSELFPSAPLEALKAQAVAARGQVLAKMGTRHHGDPFHLCAKVHCQVYDGLHKVYKRTTAAVLKTKGEVLFDGRGLPADTVYHSSSGGHGENNENVWGGEPKPYLRGRPDGVRWSYTDEASLSRFLLTPQTGAFCRQGNRRFRWSIPFTQKRMRSLLKKGHMRGTLRSLKPLRRGVSGRILELEVRTSKERRILRGELTIRRFFGGLYSSMFLIKKSGKGYTFTGGGFGHGVGMSQWGAINRAKKGQRYRQILNHYYKGTKLLRMY